MEERALANHGVGVGNAQSRQKLAFQRFHLFRVPVGQVIIAD